MAKEEKKSLELSQTEKDNYKGERTTGGKNQMQPLGEKKIMSCKKFGFWDASMIIRCLNIKLHLQTAYADSVSAGAGKQLQVSGPNEDKGRILKMRTVLIIRTVHFDA